jgi:predicted nuclease of predicted toxin-antitoxin system
MSPSEAAEQIRQVIRRELEAVEASLEDGEIDTAKSDLTMPLES